MITRHTPETLRAFEDRIAEDFNAGRIRAPVHLAGGCEEQMIGIFERVCREDWVLSQWRSHYHCLLKGVPPERLREDILAGRSIALCYPEYKVLSSAIVGGVLPIGIGVAMAIKREVETCAKVWIFVGDMTAETGAFSECVRYATGHNLPVEFVVEDNGRSVCTDTKESWGRRASPARVTRFSYDLSWPHSGAGKRVEF